MSELFADAFSGEVLIVSAATDLWLADKFPDVDRWSEYKSADAYLVLLPVKQLPKNTRRFLTTWLRKAHNACVRERIRAEYKDAQIARGLRVGTGPRG